MKRISIIRRRRYLAWALSLGVATALLLPAGALAGYDAGGAGTAIDPYAASGLSAEDVHGASAAGATVVLPQADRNAVEQAAKVTAAPKVVSEPSTSSSSTIAWGQIALYSSLGLLGLLAAFAVALLGKRGTPVAHS